MNQDHEQASPGRRYRDLGGPRSASPASFRPSQGTDSPAELSERWCAKHPPVDGDDRTPLEVWQAGLITTAEFYALVSE